MARCTGDPEETEYPKPMVAPIHPAVCISLMPDYWCAELEKTDMFGLIQDWGLKSRSSSRAKG